MQNCYPSRSQAGYLFRKKAQTKAGMRIAGVNIPDSKRVQIGLTQFYGIGRTQALALAKLAKLNLDTRIKDLNRNQLSALVKALENFKTEGSLRREIRESITRLQAIKCYRGLRHTLGLPVHGQRTKSNARTRKGKRKTVGSLTKEAWSKTEAGLPPATKKED